MSLFLLCGTCVVMRSCKWHIRHFWKWLLFFVMLIFNVNENGFCFLLFVSWIRSFSHISGRCILLFIISTACSIIVVDFVRKVDPLPSVNLWQRASLSLYVYLCMYVCMYIYIHIPMYTPWGISYMRTQWYYGTFRSSVSVFFP